jgi:hypothetical protein
MLGVEDSFGTFCFIMIPFAFARGSSMESLCNIVMIRRMGGLRLRFD